MRPGRKERCKNDFCHMTADSHAEYYAGYALDEWDKIRGKTLFRFGGSSTDPTAILTSLNNFPCIFSMNEYHAAGVSFCDFLAGQVIYCSIACLDRDWETRFCL